MWLKLDIDLKCAHGGEENKSKGPKGHLSIR